MSACARIQRRSGGERPRALLVLAAALAAPLACALLAVPARAGFGPIEIQSVNAIEQAESAGEPAISGDGRYLALQETLNGVFGVWRKNMQTGQLQLVTSSGSAPSLSSDGRYVSFTSSEALVKAAKSGENVYVRDMTIDPALEGPCTQAQEAEGQCPYELASALNGSSEGLTYDGGGALASGRVALSADGREVAFVIDGTSNLTSESDGSTPGTPTPGGQVAVRHLDRRETMLVSTEREPGTGQMTDRPVAAGAVTPDQTGAALSGDGSTVAWLGAHIPAQAPTLSGEGKQIELDDERPSFDDQAYDEPLWRRIADGPDAPTRRMVGGGDPLAPGCPPGGTIEIRACQGPYPRLAWEDSREEQGSNYGWLGISGYDGIPHLSYDGWTAALIGDPDSTSNVFVVNMHEGLDRVQALRELTPEVPVPETTNPGFSSPYVATAGDVYDIAISPDGTRIAFTTQRQQFPLAPLIYTEAPPTQLGVVELYEIVDDEALERVTHGQADGPSLEGSNPVIVTSKGAATPSFTEDDLTLAFADTASNLVYGDANGASDVFTATEAGTSNAAGPAEIGPAPPGREPAVPQWRLSAVPITHADGSVTLDVAVPGAGELYASATAIVPVPIGGHTASTRTRRGRAAHAAAGGKRKGLARRGTRSELESRPVATARMSAEVPGLLELPLRVAGSYTSLLSTPAGIYATVHVTFTGSGGPGLTQTLAVSLHRAKTKEAAKKKIPKRARVRHAGKSKVRKP